MKKLNILIILSIISVFMSLGFTKNFQTSDVNIRISFGRPSAGNCVGRGTCSIEEDNSRRGKLKAIDSKAKGTISINNDGKIVLKVFKESISVKTATEQFIDGKFLVHDELEIPKKITKKLINNRANLRLVSGEYRVRENTDIYTIVLN